ncbi:hypothetical protein A8L51_12785 [Pantoea stewartii]|nr:hypothetical protein [Pantoea stewartii]
MSYAYDWKMKISRARLIPTLCPLSGIPIIMVFLARRLANDRDEEMHPCVIKKTAFAGLIKQLYFYATHLPLLLKLLSCSKLGSNPPAYSTRFFFHNYCHFELY